VDVRPLGWIGLVHSHGEDTTRSAAGRAAVEAAVWSPATCAVTDAIRIDERPEQIVDLYITHAKNGVRLSQLERQRLHRIRRTGSEQTPRR
jgi:hypothetical protein